MNETPRPLRVRATTTCKPSPCDLRASFQLVGIVPIDFQGRQAEGAELRRQRLKVGDFPRRTKSLKTVQVDQQGQVLEPLMAGEDQSLPAKSPRSTRRLRSGKIHGRLSFERLARASPAARESPCPRLPVAKRMSSMPEAGG